MQSTGKCPNCAATLMDPMATACPYCGNAFAPPPPREKSPAEQLSYEISGLGCLTVLMLVVAGIFWQIGWDKVAVAVAAAWLVIIVGSTYYLIRRFGRG